MRKIQHFEAFGAICVFPLIQKWPEKPTFKDFHGSAFEPGPHSPRILAGTPLGSICLKNLNHHLCLSNPKIFCNFGGKILRITKHGTSIISV